MLFTMELFKMYSNFAALNGWTFNVAAVDASDIGICRHGNLRKLLN